jgi:hypothetical protein
MTSVVCERCGGHVARVFLRGGPVYVEHHRTWVAGGVRRFCSRRLVVVPDVEAGVARQVVVADRREGEAVMREAWCERERRVGEVLGGYGEMLGPTLTVVV